MHGEEIEEVDNFIYLGSTITNKGNSAPEIRRRLAMARAVVSKNGQHLEESTCQLESQAEGAMGHCLPHSYIWKRVMDYA